MTMHRYPFLRALLVAWLLAAPALSCSSGDDEHDTIVQVGDGDEDAGELDASITLMTFECGAMGGTVINDTGDGSLQRDGCPGLAITLGIVSDTGVFGLCCFTDPTLCTPQRLHVESPCTENPSYYWLGDGCAAIRECDCTGPDCGKGFETEDECMAERVGCEIRGGICGNRNSGSCPGLQYCFESSCMRTFSGGICVTKPTSCDAGGDPVCGCDGVTYGNLCEAEMAGQNVSAFSACEASSL